LEIEKLNEKIKTQASIIKRLRRYKIQLEEEVEQLNKDLYFENNKRPNNHKTRLRVKDIVDMYSVGKSTVWFYANNRDITPIKNSSRVTTFDAKEVKSFFKSINKKAKDITPNLNAAVAKERTLSPQMPPKLISKEK